MNQSTSKKAFSTSGKPGAEPGHTEYGDSQANLFSPMHSFHQKLELAQAKHQAALEGKTLGHDINTYRRGLVHVEDTIDTIDPSSPEGQGRIVDAELFLKLAETELVLKYAEQGQVFDLDTMKVERTFALMEDKGGIVDAARAAYDDAFQRRAAFLGLGSEAVQGAPTAEA